MLVGCRIGGGTGQRAVKRRLAVQSWVEMRPFLAPEAVIFGVVFTGPYILVVKDNILIWLSSKMMPDRDRHVFC